MPKQSGPKKSGRKSKAVSLIAIGLFSGFCINYLSASAVSFDPQKAHHSEGRFISTIKGSMFGWMKMRRKEGPFPAVSEADKAAVITKADLALIALPGHKSSHKPGQKPGLKLGHKPRATWIGHATMLVQYQGVNFLTDPHLSQRAAPIDFFAPTRLTQPALSFEQLPKIDFVVISHNHYDHLDHRTVDKLGNSVLWYVPLGMKSWFEGRGIDSDRVIELDWWQSHQYQPGATITFTPSVHWSKRTPFNTNKSLWGSWAVKIDDFNSWFGGDTGYDPKTFKQIGEKLGPFQLGMIPIGAYSPRHFMAPQHVDPDQAVKIHRDIRAAQSLPIHWATFQLTSEPFLEPPQLLKIALKQHGIAESDFPVIKIGETQVLAN